jgi:protoheme IX farnesyltransferase
MKDLIRFTRFYLSLAVSFSALFTYLVATKQPSFEIIIPWFGVLFLALGSSALNQVQEKQYDKKMNRTLKRPMVSGAYSFKKGFTISILLIVSSLFMLNYSMEILGIYFTLSTLLIYNLIYTYLKPITHWALILGSFLGVIAPSIGWLVANNLNLYSLYQLKFIYIFILYFVWQVPHFWLLVLINKNDYKKAGFPTLKDKIGQQGLMRTISIWNIISVSNGVTVIFTSQVSMTLWILTLLSSIYIVYSSFLLFFTKEIKGKFFKIRFMELNTYILLIMVLLIVDNLI